jgi:hypothetical protein
MKFSSESFQINILSPETVPPTDVIGDQQYRKVFVPALPCQFHRFKIPSDHPNCKMLEKRINEEMVFSF